jgi:dihydrofolate reductase
VGKLIYSAITSLDGYVADANGNFDWAAPDEEVHRFVNDLERPVGTYLLGRRMYEVMRYWDSPEATEDQPDVMTDFARIWRAADKVVYSKTLASVSASRTRLVRDFDANAVRDMKHDPRDISVGGPSLAAHAIRAGLVDELQLFLTPHIVGGGTPSLPGDVRLDLELIDERHFVSGVVYLRYRINLDT